MSQLLTDTLQVVLKEPQLLYFGTENFEQFTSQIRFQYQSFKFHLIWSRNGTEM